LGREGDRPLGNPSRFFVLAEMITLLRPGPGAPGDSGTPSRLVNSRSRLDSRPHGRGFRPQGKSRGAFSFSNLDIVHAEEDPPAGHRDLAPEPPRETEFVREWAMARGDRGR